MKKILILCLYLSAFGLVFAQSGADDVVIVDDEECGCELVFIDGIQTTQDGDHYGFKRADGTVIVGNIYLFVDQFHGNYCKVYRDYGRCGLIDREGNEIVPCLYEDVQYPIEGRILVLDNEYYGYYDTLGRQAIPFTWRAASGFSQGKAVVAVDIDTLTVLYGYIDTLGNIVLPPVYEYAYPFSEGYAVVKQYDRYGMIDHQGREVVTCKYEVLTAMSDGVYFAGSTEAVALYDKRFRRLTPQVYNAIVSIDDRRILVARDGKYGFLDYQGHEVIPCEYDQAKPFRHGRAAVSKGGHWGIVDTLGNIVLPIEYDNSGYRGEAYNFHDGLALIEKDGLYGYCNLDGQPIVYPSFTDAYQFHDGLAPVEMGKWGYIDTEGKFFIAPQFDVASPFEYRRAEVMYNGEVHKMDTRGNCVKNCKNAPKTWKR